jgi:hypothetical protein
MPKNDDLKDAKRVDTPTKENESPESKKTGSTESSDGNVSPNPSGLESPESNLNQASPANPRANTSGKKTRYRGKGVDANGRPRNFYNPPGKVLRSLAN